MMLALFVALFLWLRWLAPTGQLDLAAVRSHLRRERASLGAWTLGERNTLQVFLLVVALWIAPSMLSLVGYDDESRWMSEHFPEEIVALLAPVILFLLPIDWRRRQFSLDLGDVSHIDWGTLTGLVKVLGRGAFDWLGTDDIWSITALAIVGGIVLSEFTSNAASATALIPVVWALCQEAGVDPVPPLMGVTFASSFGSALPVSTPPNAIVYGSRLLPALRMMLAGLGFDVACGLIIWSVLRVPWAGRPSPQGNNASVRSFCSGATGSASVPPANLLQPAATSIAEVLRLPRFARGCHCGSSASAPLTQQPAD
jgi:sodium-dependent dicarboxylate transporter 2/3/5